MIIAFCGEKGSGKDFLAEQLQNNWIECTSILDDDHIQIVDIYSFAYELKKCCSALFPTSQGWPDWHSMSSEERDGDIDFNKLNLNPNHVTLYIRKYRDVLKHTANFIKSINPNHFNNVMLDLITSYLKANYHLAIITDFRYDEEYRGVIKPHDITTIKIINEFSEDKKTPDPTEEYVRQFRTTYKFINKGSKEESSKRFIEFMKSVIAIERIKMRMRSKL